MNVPAAPPVTLAVVGLGAIGGGMATNLCRAGFTVRGYDPDPKACDRLRASGGTVSPDPAGAARGADSVLCCVFDAAQARTVLFAATGVLGELAAGTPVLMHTTMSPAEVRELARDVAAHGQVLVDAPVTGGKRGADEATLTIICAAPETVLDGLTPVFDAVSRTVYRAGHSAGDATTIKLVNQLLMGVHLTATAEALNFALEAGADPELVYDVITHGTGRSVAFESRFHAMLERDFTPQGIVEIFIKDLGAVTRVGASIGCELALAKTAFEKFEQAVAAGFGQADCSALIEVYRALSNRGRVGSDGGTSAP